MGINLDLSDNQLSDSIPSSLGNLTNLTVLNLGSNQLVGSIPSSLGSLTNLARLYLHHNQLSGTIPSSLGNLSKLIALYLNHNQLSGTIPSSLGNLTNLSGLWLQNNNFTFDGMELIATKFPFAVYAPQAPIKIVIDPGVKNIFEVKVGGKLINNTYRWTFQYSSNPNKVIFTKKGDSTSTYFGAGYYYVSVTNAIDTQLTLYSDTLFYLPVPIKSINLQAKEIYGQVLLHWHTVTELNTSHFIIQHSVDGVSFTDIGTVKAMGRGGNSYSFTDNNPTNGINYYRLQSVDKDGVSSYSKIVSASLSTFDSRLSTISVAPNPAKDIVTIKGSHIIYIEVLDNIGRVIKTQTLKDATNPTLSVGGLPVGIYHLRLQTTDGKVSGVGFVKE